MSKKSVYKLSLEDLVSIKARETSKPFDAKNGQIIEIVFDSQKYTGLIILADKDAVLLLTDKKLRWFSRYLKCKIL